LKRAFILVLDSFGIGASQDAAQFGDEGADTFGHIAEKATNLSLPHLAQLGLAHAHLASTGTLAKGFSQTLPVMGRFGYAVENSYGKDTPSGHWEMAGCPALFDWGYFNQSFPSFPDDLIQALITEGQLPGILGNKAASGTEIIEELGEEHIKTGKPIIYTSADSVFQIAVHEEHFGLTRLFSLCQLARKLVDPLRIGRVIARPFIGEQKGQFKRTYHRKDFSTPPPRETLLDLLKKAGHEVIAIGKIADIFAHRGITQTISGQDNMSLFDATLKAAQEAKEGALIFTNFVDFDTLYGHRRDIEGYAKALEAFDARLPELLTQLQKEDMLILTADHGCDPSFPGSDHTREHVPILQFSPQIQPGFLGRRESFADIGQTVAKHLSLPPLDYGIAF